MDDEIVKLARENKIPESMKDRYWSGQNKDIFGMSEELKGMGLIGESRRDIRNRKEQEIKAVDAVSENSA